MPRVLSDRYIRFYNPILESLRAHGGSGSRREITDDVLDRYILSEAELVATNRDGSSRVRAEIDWARSSLKDLGILDGSERGVWKLTEAGLATTLTLEQARALRTEWYRMRQGGAEMAVSGTTVEVEEIVEEESVAEASAPSLLRTLVSLSPSGFERLCQRVLRESGFSEVHVTGKSGDGGIDGYGVLQINELVSFRVLFQCKRYEGSVGPAVVRELQGAMQGRADKGLVLTTGTFTRAAKDESGRPGALPVELVDGERLVALMERLGLGVRPRTVYDVDAAFFAEYR